MCALWGNPSRAKVRLRRAIFKRPRKRLRVGESSKTSRGQTPGGSGAIMTPTTRRRPRTLGEAFQDATYASAVTVYRRPPRTWLVRLFIVVFIFGVSAL